MQRRRSPARPHPAACEAAAAVRHGAQQERRVGREDGGVAVHATSRRSTPDQVKEAAQDVAGIQDFDAKYDGALLEVRSDVGMGAMLGVKSTPTFFINGRKICRAGSRGSFDAAIDLEMRRAK